jgi:DNA-binding LytR/AlgR family response regulator
MTKEGESLIRKTIRDLTDELDPERFWRIHRGTIVNVHHIAKTGRSLSGNSIIKLVDRPEVLSISRSYTHLFRQM